MSPIFPVRIPLFLTLLFLACAIAPTHAQDEPAIAGSLADQLSVDGDGDGVVDRGDTIEYTVTIRNNGDGDAQSVTLTIPSTMDLSLLPDSLRIGPIALDDTARVAAETSVTIDVLANDRDVDGTLDATTVTIVEAPSAGSAMVDPVTGMITYTAPATVGPETIRYTVTDDDGIVSRQALVSVTVNACPVAQNDAVATMGNVTLTGNVLADNGSGTDGDGDAGDALSVVAVNGVAVYVGTEITLPSGALLTLNANGDFSYNPNGVFDELASGEDDTDSFTYTLSDGLCEDSATVTVTVSGENMCPTAADDAFSTDENSPVAGNLLSDNGGGADTDPDTSNALTVSALNGNVGDVGTSVTLGSGAALTLNADGSFSYDPNGAFESLAAGGNDTDSFTYTLSDGTCTDDATVTISIDGVNDCPVARNDDVTTDEDNALNGNVLLDNGNGADTDIDSGAVFTVTAINGSAAGVGNLVTLGSGATVTLNADGTFSYDPNGAFEDLAVGADESDSFTYTLSDGTCTDDATVSITINGVNDCPVASNDSVATDEDNTLNGDLLADNGSGPDSDGDTGDTLTITAINGAGANVGNPVMLASGAQLTVNADGTFTYDPNGAFESLAAGSDDTDSFTYTLSDGTCTDDGTATITITGVNDCPLAAADAVSTDEDSATMGNVLADNGTGADSDADTGAMLSVTAINGSGANVGALVTLGSGAEVTLNSDGSFTYNPNGMFESLAAGSDTTDTFTYTVSDGTCSDNGTVTMMIDGVNDGPLASTQSSATFGNIELVANSGSLMAAATGSPAVTVTGNLLTGATDVDTPSGSLSAVAATGASANSGSFQVFADGSFAYRPPAGFTGGNDTFTYAITDGLATSAAATVTIAVSDQVWFINNTAGGSGGTGTSSDPFLTTADFNTANGSGASAPAAGDRIFLFQGGGNYTTGISLLNNQTLEGQGVALVVSSNTLLAAGAAPTITSATTDGISLASGNTLRGLNVANTPGFHKISGTAVGNLAVSDVALTGTGGAIEITTSGALGNNVTFSTLESTSSPGPAIDLTGVSGTLAVTSAGSGLSGNNSGSDLVRITGGSVSMSYPGNATKASLGALLRVSNGHATGTIQFPTGVLSATSGTGLQFDNADGVYTFGATTTLNGGDAGIDITNGSDGNFTFTNAPITNPSGVALNIDGGNGTISHGGAIAKNSAGQLVDIQSRAGGSVTVTGALSATGSSSGMRAQNNTGGTITFSAASKTINIATGTALALANNTGASVTFSNGGLAITNTAGAGINASTAGALTISGSGNTVTATGGPALDLDNTTLTTTFASLSATNATTHGIDISNVPSASTFTVTGTTSIANPTSRGLNIDDVESGSTLSFGDATVTNRSSDGIAIRDFDGASLSFGDVDITNASNAGGNGVLVNKAGATSSGAITFASLDISNTVTTVVRADAGADGIPDNETDDGHGVKLVDHTGGFTISGAGAQGNGGTIQNIHGDGISMLRSSGLDVDSLTINNIGTANNAAATVDNAGVFAVNITGSHHIKDSTISRFQDGGAAGSNARGVYVTNTGTNFTEFRVTDTTFFNDNALRGDDAILLTTSGAVTGSLVVESLFPVGHGSNRSDFYNLSGNAVQVLQNAGSGTITTDISNSLFRNAISTGGFGGIELASASSGVMSNMVSGCEFYSLCPLGVNNGGVVTLFASGSVDYDATVDGCTFGNAGTVTSLGRGAIRAATGDLLSDTPTDFDISITNNTIDNTDREAITLFARGGAVPTGTIDFVVTGNMVGTNSPVAFSGREGIEFRAYDNPKTVDFLFENNVVNNFANSTSDETFDFDVEDSAVVYAQILGNTFTLDGTSVSNPNSVEINTEGAGTFLCVDLNTNGGGGSPNSVDDSILLTQAAGVFNVEDGGGTPVALVTTRNTGTVNSSGTIGTCSNF